VTEYSALQKQGLCVTSIINNTTKSDQKEFWFAAGELIDQPVLVQQRGNPYSTLLSHQNTVHLSSNSNITTVRWIMAGANWLSLLVVQHFLSNFKGPFRLEFFNGGWFKEEFYATKEAAKRIDHLLVKSDLRFSSKVFIRTVTPKLSTMPELLRQAFESGCTPPAETVHCGIDQHTGRVNIETIGENSTLAKVWGQTPNSFPCVFGNSFDAVVSKPYYDVIETGKPHYDHVSAAMMKPNGRVDWINYQRIVFPSAKLENGNHAVKALCALAPVDISMW
jgi:hypothetical protein